jgi:hypothetical protein
VRLPPEVWRISSAVALTLLGWIIVESKFLAIHNIDAILLIQDCACLQSFFVHQKKKPAHWRASLIFP